MNSTRRRLARESRQAWLMIIVCFGAFGAVVYCAALLDAARAAF